MDWQERLAVLAREYRVPGASLAFWHDGELTQAVTGVLNIDTGAPVVPDALFQIGSITKIWTTSMVLLLVEQGRLTLDTRVRDVLPGFTATAPDVTIRHLLTHTSGIDGDLFVDTGRGDDCVQRYAAACARQPPVFPPGTSFSYSNAGFVTAGRVIEVITGQVWDDALREMIIEPLGLTHTCTLPEDVLRYAASTGHLGATDGTPLRATPQWALPRAIGPAGLICARAADVVAFGRAHLAGGLLRTESAQAMREPLVDVPNPLVLGPHWGLGWIMQQVGGRWIAQHGGNTIGQAAMLWTVPDSGTVGCLLMNGGHTTPLLHAVGRELLGDLCGLGLPAAPTPPASPPALAIADFAGTYARTGTTVTVRADGTARVEFTGDLDDPELSPPLDMRLVPYAVTEREATFLCRRDGEPDWESVAFYTLPDGGRYVHLGGRATPMVSGPQ